MGYPRRGCPLDSGAGDCRFSELHDRRKHPEEETFKGLPGLLADSLPDRYVNQLIETWLAQNGRSPQSMNPVEKHCFIGNRGMGAMEFEPARMKAGKQSVLIELESLVEVAGKMLSERESFKENLNEDEKQSMREVLKIGTSAGGARPKAVIAYNTKRGRSAPGRRRFPADLSTG